MEPLDTDMDYVVSEPRQPRPGSRLTVMLILPILGFLLLLIFIGAAIFQWNLSDLVDSLVGVLLLLFVVAIVLLFWGLAPRANEAENP